ncbi:hypothetical protein J0H58_37100, partial [bacterium]|nr:hypothetical protein [bacterium]
MPRRSVVVTAACCAAAAACLLPPSAAQDPADEVARRLRQWEADPTRRPLPALTLPPPGRAVPPPAARDATATGRRWSLHAGVNKLHPGRYPGVPELEAAEDDARTLAAAAQASGFEAKLLVGEAATVAAVLAEVDRAV